MKRNENITETFQGNGMDEVLRANTSNAQEAKKNTEKWEFIKLPQHSNYIHLKKEIAYRTLSSFSDKGLIYMI